jgi:hypothetical protein
MCVYKVESNSNRFQNCELNNRAGKRCLELLLLFSLGGGGGDDDDDDDDADDDDDDDVS